MSFPRRTKAPSPTWVDPRLDTGAAAAITAMLTCILSPIAGQTDRRGPGGGLPTEYDAGYTALIQDIAPHGSSEAMAVSWLISTLLLVPLTTWAGARWVAFGAVPGAPARTLALATWLAAAVAFLAGGLLMHFWVVVAHDLHAPPGALAATFTWYAAYGLIWGSVPAAAAALEWRWLNRRNARRLAAQRSRT